MKPLIKYMGISLVCLMGLICFTACNKGEAAYIVQPTPIRLTVLTDKTTASTAQIHIAPVDDRAYFFVDTLPAGWYKPGTMDRDFMMLVMDSIYIDYLTWRHDHLKDAETYIAPFSSHCLKYGVQTVHFNELSANSEYMVYAFCVNPVTNQPMGDLYFDYFTTDSLRQRNLSFQFALEGQQLYIMPSDDETQYVSAIISEEELKWEFDGDPYQYLSTVVAIYKEFGLLDFVVHKNAYFEDLEGFLDPDTYYVALACAYDGEFADTYTRREIYVDPDGGYHLVAESSNP